MYTGYNTDADGFRLSLAAAGIPFGWKGGSAGLRRSEPHLPARPPGGCAVVDAVRDPLSPRAPAREDVERLVPGASFELVSMGGVVR